MIKNYLSHFLPVLLALDLIIPFLLAPFYKDYNHLTQVMSVLGNIVISNFHRHFSFSVLQNSVILYDHRD